MRKKLCFWLIVLVMAAFSASTVLAVTETLIISSEPGADSFTGDTVFKGSFNLSISGSGWVATVHLQRSFDAGTTWVDIQSWSTNYEAVVVDPQEGGLYYRIGIKNGNYTSGTINMRLTK